MTQEARRSTMVDVAREAGVSLKTVSRVLNEESYVRAETRDAVLDAAARLDYKLNQAARTLRGGSAQIIVLFVNVPNAAYMESIHLGALEQCHKLSMQMVMDNCPEGVAGVKRVLETLSPSGVILTPPLCDDPEIINLLDNAGVSYVLVSPTEPQEELSFVDMDNVAGAREITEYLLDMGHRRIGFIRGHPDHGASEKRHEGYRQAFANRGLDIDGSLLRQGYFDYASGLECAESLLDAENPPTAIFASNDDMAAAAISAAYSRNIRVPQQVSIVGFDDTSIAAIISPHLTTVRQPISKLASEAVSLLSDMMSRPNASQRSVHLVHQIVIRESAAPPRKE